MTQADLNAGSDLVNVAVVDTDQTDEQQDDATSTVAQTASLEILKSLTPSDVETAFYDERVEELPVFPVAPETMSAVRSLPVKERAFAATSSGRPSPISWPKSRT